MLCAFNSYEDFHECVSQVHQSIERFSNNMDIVSTMFVFRAAGGSDSSQFGEDKFVQEGDGWISPSNPDTRLHSIYGLAIQKTKIQVLEEWKTFDELRETFPSIPKELIEKVWTQQHHSWQSCIQILKSLLLSKARVLLDDCDFLFELERWPGLTQNPFQTAGGNSTNLLACEDWMLVNMASYLSNPSESLRPRHVLNDWQIIKETLSLPEFSMESSEEKPRSYRDILLSAPQISGDVAQTTKVRSEKRHSWKPKILIEQISDKRKDRIYMNTKLSGLLADNDLTEDEKVYLKLMQEEEDEFEWDACCNGKFASQVLVGIKRKALATYIRPNTQDQKMKRIAMKMK